MKQSLKANLKQKFSLTNTLKQQINILSLTNHELRKKFLDVFGELIEDENISQKKFKSELFLDNFISKEINIEQTQEISLKNHLLGQLDQIINPGYEHLIGEYLIDSIEDSGKLDSQIDFDDIKLMVAEEFKINIRSSDIKKILKEVHQMDPIGCGFSSIMETLTIQLEDMNLEDEQENELKEVLVRLSSGISILDDYSKEVRRIIKSLNPEPGWKIGSNSSIYIKPEIRFNKTKQEWSAYLVDSVINEDLFRDLRINLNKIQNKKKKAEAKILLAGLKSRNTSLLLVAQLIATHQSNYLDNNEAHLEPLILKDLSKTLNLHESSISRLINNKYVQLPKKIIPIKSLLSKSIGDKKLGIIVSSEKLKKLIIKIINSEDEESPLSDSQISSLLKETLDLKVSRRTITKYRGYLKIESSSIRKSEKI